MKKLKIYLLIIGLVYSNISHSQSGWFWQNPLPQGNNLSSVKYMNINVIYGVGDAGTFMKSTNGGFNWIFTHKVSGEILGGAFDGIAPALNSSFFMNNSTGFAVGNKILRTTNAGDTWDSITSTIDLSSFKSIFFINDYTGWSCYNADNYTNNTSNLLKTTNGGLNWFMLTNSIKTIHSIYFVNPNTGWFAGHYTNFIGGYSQFHILKTTDGGISSSTQLSIPESQTLKTIFFINELTGWVGGTKIWKTTDSGVTWNSQNIAANSIAFINSQTGYCANNSSILKTTNSGMNWVITSTAGGNSISLLGAESVLVGGNNGSLLKTTNMGNNWDFLSQNITNNSMDDIFFINENTGFCISNYNYMYTHSATILKTTDKGVHWSYNLQNTSVNLYDIFFVNETTGWCSGDNGILYKTTNTGINWVIQNLNTNKDLYKVYFTDLNTGWILSGASVFLTSNGGLNWNMVNITETFLNGMNYSFLYINEGTRFIAGIGGVGKTTNGGYNWNRVFDLAIQDLDKDSLDNLYAISLDNLYKSTDLGNSWQLISSPSKLSVDIEMLNSTTGYMICLRGNILKTSDGGITWATTKLMTNEDLYSIFAIDTNNIWVAGYNGVIMSTVVGGVVTNTDIHVRQMIPEEYSLSQNYPNPFNPQTKIKFSVPKASYTKLIIYDLLGKVVAILVNEELKPGTYEADWDGSNYSSGVYFYKLVAGDFTETKKMVLMK